MIQKPFIAAPLQPHVPEALALLVRRSSGKMTERDKKLGIDLLIDTYCGVIDHLLLDLIDEIGRRYDSRQIADARRLTEEVKHKARHYIGWAGGLISAQRLPPVIAHFNGLVHEFEGKQVSGHHVLMPVSIQVAQRSDAILVSLKDGTAKDLAEGIALLSRIVEDLMIPLAIAPKNLLQFNFMVSKPLDGAIALIRSLIIRALAKFGSQIHKDLYPLIGTHLEQFLVLESRG